MKRYFTIPIGVLLLTGVAWLQVPPPRPKAIAELIPPGALLAIEAKDFHALLSSWDQSQAKAKWLKSANYEQFTQSNLFQKMSGVFDEYNAASQLAPGLADMLQIAGSESALALYDPRELEFLYITRLDNTALSQSRLWGMRAKFEERQSAGKTFYLRTGSKRTVAFAFSGDYFFLATRDDLIAQALALQSGAQGPNLAGERWYADAAQASSGRGDLRMTLDLQSLVNNTYFRSYWIHRNVSDLKPFRSEICDLDRTGDGFTERRILLRQTDVPSAPTADLSPLVSFAPSSIGLYRVFAAVQPETAAQWIEEKLLYPTPSATRDDRIAPPSDVQPDAGTEADLETRIDALPVPSEQRARVMEILKPWLTSANITALAEYQSSERPQGSDFVSTPAAIALLSSRDWDADAARIAFRAALTARVSEGNVGTLDGLARRSIAIRGRVLLLANDAALLQQILATNTPQTGAPGADSIATFHHAGERDNFMRIMHDLDAAPAINNGMQFRNAGAAPFFSANLGSLSEVLSSVSTVTVTQQSNPNSVVQLVEYR